MPKFAALIKVTNCRQFGANVVLHGADLTEARAHAGEIAARDGLTFIHPFDNADVIAGQGTMGLEILEQTPDVEAIVVPVGGGGLIAGIGTAVKAKAPQVSIIGVEPDRAACLTEALAQDAPTLVPLSHTLADGLAVAKLGDVPFGLVKRVVDRVVTVDEATIALAILRLIELEKSVVEGAGAAPLAAFIAGRLDMLKGKRVVLVLAGGNIDSSALGRIIDVGLVADGRLCRLQADDQRQARRSRAAGRIDRRERCLDQGDRPRPRVRGPDLSAVRVVCVAETMGHEHVRQLHAALAAAGAALWIPKPSGRGTCDSRRDRACRVQSFRANSRLVFFRRVLVPKYACFDMSAE
jgi:threonine dehydratase